MTTTNNKIDLKANNFELVRAALTAADQAYGLTEKGFHLQAIDNSGAGRSQPWETPSGWQIVKSIEEKNFGGKIVLYTNEQAKQVMVVPMGTNGNTDVRGWYTNFKDFGRTQLKAKLSGTDVTVQDVLFKEMNQLLGQGYQSVIFSGDSKGGALVQFIVHDIITVREKGALIDQELTHLASLHNHQIAIVAHNAPGVETALQAENLKFNPQSPQYDGIQTMYIVSKMQDKNTRELVSQTGGRYLAHDGWVYQNELGVGIDPGQIKKNANAYVYLHRLTQSLYDGMDARYGDFSLMPQVPRTMMSINELAAFGGALSSIGEGEAVNTLEAKARVGSAAICAGVTAPFPALAGVLKGEVGLQTVIGLGSLALWTIGAGPIMAGLCGVSIVGANGAKYLGGKDQDIVVSNADLQSAIHSVDAPASAPEGKMRVFGYTKEGGTYVADVSEYGVGGTLYCHEKGIRTIAALKSHVVDVAQFDSQTGKALGHGIFSCQDDGHMAFNQLEFDTTSAMISKLITISANSLFSRPVIKHVPVNRYRNFFSNPLGGASETYTDILGQFKPYLASFGLEDYGIPGLGGTGYRVPGFDPTQFTIDNSRAPKIYVNPDPKPHKEIESETAATDRVEAGYVDYDATYSVQYDANFLFDTSFAATQQASMASGGVRPGAFQLDPNPKPNAFLEKQFRLGNDEGIFAQSASTRSLLNGVALGSLASGSTQQVYIDPILLDLTGEGVHMTDYATNGVLFDVAHTGTLRRTGWVDTKTGILLDDKGKTEIKDSSHFFSEYYYALPGERKYADGYAALRSVDRNKDGVINAEDPVWRYLKVWVDANHNAQSELGELKSLAELGISKISLSNRPAQPNEMRDGNIVQAYGSFTINGKEHEALSVEFIAAPTSNTIQDREKGRVLTSKADATMQRGYGTHDVAFSAPAEIKTYTSHSTEGEVLNAAQLGVNHLYGGPGNDTLVAAPAGSWLAGGGGSNIYQGGPGNDVFIISREDQPGNIRGGGGTDTAIIVGQGSVHLNMQEAGIHIAEGGPGNNVIVSGGGTGVYIRGGSGTNVLVGGAGDDVIVGGSGYNFIIGGSGKAVIHAGPNGDDIYGAEGDSIIHAGGGHDHIIAGPGNDVIVVGCGDAEIDGGKGTNIVRFHGSYGDYQVDKTASGYIVKDTLPKRDGTVTLRHVHKFAFADISVVDLMKATPAPVSDNLWVNQAGRAFDRVQSHTIAPAQILANDQLFNSRPPLKITRVSESIGGTVVLNASGEIIFTPDPAFTGMMQFKYTICDADGRSTRIEQLGTGGNAEIRAMVSLLTAEVPKDPLVTQQWYLNAANILPVWADYTGKGVRIGQFEPPGEFAIGPEILNYEHPDLAANVDPIWLAAQKAKGTLPTDFSNHATMVAGIMVASKNAVGVVGVAFNAKIIGYALDSRGMDIKGLGYAATVDVVNHSWGTSTDFLFTQLTNKLASIDSLMFSTIEYAASYGRGGLGSVIVCSGGNQREKGGSAQGFLVSNNRFVIEVGAINAAEDLSTLQIKRSAFSNPGSSILISAPGSNIFSTSQMLKTDQGSVFGQELKASEGTSFSAPIVSGIVALMLEANRHLGYRDIQHILLLSAKKVSDPNTIWQENHAHYWNGGGLHASHDYGFGAVDARAAVRLAETWLSKNTAENEMVLSKETTDTLSLQGGKIRAKLMMPAGLRIEHVEIDLDMTFSNLSDLVVKLISPTRTESLLLNRHGINPAGMAKGLKTASTTTMQATTLTYRFMTTHDWGELSEGEWTLEVTNVKSGAATTLKSWALHLYGSQQTQDDIYFYTDEYANLAKINPQRAVLDDAVNGSPGGKNTIHAAAVSGNVEMNLLTGVASINRQSLTIKRPQEIHNLFTGDGNDILVAGPHGGVLYGGRGHNTLIGNLGIDVFVVRCRPNGKDILTAFNPAHGDKIYVVGSALQLEQLAVKIEGPDTHIHLPNTQRIILQQQIVALATLKSSLIIQDILRVPVAYIVNNKENVMVDNGEVVLLTGGGNGARASLVAREAKPMFFNLNSGSIEIKFNNDANPNNNIKWSLAGKIYQHTPAYVNSFVVLPTREGKCATPSSSGVANCSEHIDFRNTISGFHPDRDQIDLSVLNLQSFNDLIIQQRKYGEASDVAIIQGTEILSRSLGDEKGPAVLAYLDAVDPMQMTTANFIFAKEDPRLGKELRTADAKNNNDALRAASGIDPDLPIIAPVILSLSNPATSFTPIAYSKVCLDWLGTGKLQHMAWTGKNQGFLAYDKNQDGTITDLNEIAFVDYLPGAQTDLEGLAGFDSNEDGKLDNQDAAWTQFGVWHDQDANGHCDTGEFRSLAEWQIQSISLASDQVTTYLDDVTIFGTGQYTRQDGSQGVLFDTALHFEEVTLQEWESHVVGLTNNLINIQAMAPASEGGTVCEEKSVCSTMQYFSPAYTENQALTA